MAGMPPQSTSEPEKPEPSDGIASMNTCSPSATAFQLQDPAALSLVNGIRAFEGRRSHEQQSEAETEGEDAAQIPLNFIVEVYLLVPMDSDFINRFHRSDWVQWIP
jgi:hypothetical protein